MVEVQKLKVFCDFCCSNWSSWFARLLPEPAGRGFDSSLVRGGVARCNLHFTATCAEQLAQSKLHRATCADQLAPTSLRRAPCLEQLAQSNLRRATCTEQLAQSSLHRATCRERNLHRATCRDQLAGATCAEQLAQSNLHSATCVEQLAQTNLHRPVCAEHLAWCCLALASRSVGKKNASCSVGPTSLAMFCFRANRGLVLKPVSTSVLVFDNSRQRLLNDAQGLSQELVMQQSRPALWLGLRLLCILAGSTRVWHLSLLGLGCQGGSLFQFWWPTALCVLHKHSWAEVPGTARSNIPRISSV